MLSPLNTSRWRREAGASSTRRREPVPTIVAEALIELPDPLAGILTIGPDAPWENVRDSLGSSVAPLEAPCPAPSWLRPEQVAPFRRAVAAIERYRGVMLADPVGSGKTWIAMAVADVLHQPAVAIVPASLREQWRRVAAELGIAMGIHSHEALSRGRLPQSTARFVIVDESHRFRTSGIRRYRELARFLVGRRLLLLSATPVVNRLSDLGHQLRLGIRDDALATRGVPNLPSMFESADLHGALGDLVLCRSRPADRPRALARELPWRPAEVDHEVLEALDRLALSSDPGVAALVRIVLWRALASSRDALLGALRRYRGLLDHAARASALGRTVTRAEIRSFTDGALDQLLMWEVLPTLSAAADLVLGDRAELDRLITLLGNADPDPRTAALWELLKDRKPTLVFTTSRDTLEGLRAGLAELTPAWVTGASAGIGHTRTDREIVLDSFRPNTRQTMANPTARPADRPTALLATDVAAEGLNLQLAQRVVHFDLPWTSVRVDQREGRAIRLGSANSEVEVVTLASWPELEDRLRRIERLAAKRRLTSQAGLDDDGRWLYRWRAEMAEQVSEAARGGFAVAGGTREGWLIGLALDLQFPEGHRRTEPASLIWVESDGRLIEEPRFVAQRLAELTDASGHHVSSACRQAAGRVAVAVTRTRLRSAQDSRFQSEESSPERHRLVRRMRRVASEAARRRNRRMLELADRALDWLSGGLTAGEAAAVAELSELRADQLEAAWASLLAIPRPRPVPVARLTGVIRVTTFPPCQTSVPCCSTSTAPSSIRSS